MTEPLDINVNIQPPKVTHIKKIIQSTTVEPLLLTGNLLILLFSIVLNQYIYLRVSEDLLLPVTTNLSSCGLNSTDSSQASSETSQWIFYCNVAGFTTSFIFTLLISSWGDVVGRRTPLVCIFIGFFLLMLVNVLVIHFHLSLWWLLVARVLCGLGGDYSALLACCFAYLADISSHKNRIIRLAIGEASLGLGGMVGNLVSGPWIESLGYESPMWFLLVLTFLCLLYIIFWLDESIEASRRNYNFTQRIRQLFTCGPFANIWFYIRNHDNNVLVTISVLFCLFLNLVTFNGILDVVIIYEKSFPLCWQSSYIGYSQALLVSCSLITCLVVKLLNGKVPVIYLLAFGVLSEVACLFFYAFATETWLIFVGIFVGCLSTLPVIIFRNIVSCLTCAEDQGAVFALTAVCQSIAELIGSLIFNETYSATVSNFRQAVFILAASIYSSVFLVFICINKKTKLKLMMKNNNYENMVETTA